MNGADFVADIPNKALTDDAPKYQRPMTEPSYLREAQSLDLAALGPAPAPLAAFRRLLASPTIASKRWVYRPYDPTVPPNTLVRPGRAPGAGASRGTTRAL